jgi:phosphoglycolate phosphatase-like HAD superfamily hydrolase
MHHLSFLQPYQAVEMMLSDLRARDYPLAVISNKRHDILHKEIAHVGWTHYFDCIIGAGHSERDKPAPDPLFDAASCLNMRHSLDRILYVGDTETDLLAAQNAGINVAFLQSDQLRPDLVEKYTPYWNGSAHEALADFLTEM